MPIFFSVIARGTTILAKYASCAGNFTEVVEQVLEKINTPNGKMTYSHGSYLFHYICESRIIYMCITNDDFERAKAFAFLHDMKKKFDVRYGPRAQTALAYSMNSEFAQTLASHMRYYSSDASDPDRLQQVTEQVDEIKDIMVRNIDQIAARGERLELLVDKTEDLNAHSFTFKKQSTNLARKMWWKNVKVTVILVLIAILVIYIVVTISCGGFSLPKCVKK